MSEKILQLVPKSDSAPELEVDQGLVERIESVLELAKSGDLQSFSAVGCLSNGDMLTSHGPTPDPWSDIGGLEILKQRLIERDC